MFVGSIQVVTSLLNHNERRLNFWGYGNPVTFRYFRDQIWIFLRFILINHRKDGWNLYKQWDEPPINWYKISSSHCIMWNQHKSAIFSWLWTVALSFGAAQACNAPCNETSVRLCGCVCIWRAMESSWPLSLRNPSGPLWDTLWLILYGCSQQNPSKSLLIKVFRT